VTLVEFLLARTLEDEAVAHRAAVEGANWRAASHGSVWSEDPEADPAMPVAYAEGRPLAEQAEHIARWDPARVLAECQVRRAIIEHCRGVVAAAGDPPGIDPADVPAVGHVLGLLAQPFKDHPDFDAEWLQD
jgi:hypothetical protein